MRTNTYTQTWFETFLRTYRPEQTQRERDFRIRNLPLRGFRACLTSAAAWAGTRCRSPRSAMP